MVNLGSNSPAINTKRRASRMVSILQSPFEREESKKNSHKSTEKNARS